MSADITHPKFKANPFPLYARLRGEEPVHRVVLPNKKDAWLITRYADVVAALKDERLVKDPLRIADATRVTPAWMPAAFRPLTRNMLDLDPPDHTRLRALVHRAFSPRTSSV